MKAEQIIKKMKKPLKNAQISDDKRALVIMKLADGQTIRSIESDEKIDANTILSIKQNNLDIIRQIQTKIADKKITLQEKAIFESLEITLLKLAEMKADPKLRNDARLTELMTTIKTLFEKSQTEKGLESKITKVVNEDIETKKLELVKTARLIQEGSTEELIEAITITEPQ